MVAIIKCSSSIRNVLHYNENKVNQNVAELIHSNNFAKDTERLVFSDKIRTIEKLTTLNERTKLNAVHISLNFHKSDSLSKESLQRIAETYMEKINFGNQPYLVYQHHDSGHPHLHIVTTNIQANGKRISMQNIGKNQSEKARKIIEQEFNLINAKEQILRPSEEHLKIQKIKYGNVETKRAITNVLNAVLSTYKYSSLPELNAVLKDFNVFADRCDENSRTFKNNGLVYRILDEDGKKIGTPIKASLINNKPGLKFLQKKFAQNIHGKLPYKFRLKNAIDLAFVKQPKLTLPQLKDILQRENIRMIARQNDKGIVYGLTYVDRNTKCVFNGSELGKQYSSNAIQQRCEKLGENIIIPSRKIISKDLENNIGESIIPTTDIVRPNKILLDLMIPENTEGLASELRSEDIRKKKKRKLRH